MSCPIHSNILLSEIHLYLVQRPLFDVVGGSTPRNAIMFWQYYIILETYVFHFNRLLPCICLCEISYPPDGYTIIYLIKDETIKFCMTLFVGSRILTWSYSKCVPILKLTIDTAFNAVKKCGSMCGTTSKTLRIVFERLIT